MVDHVTGCPLGNRCRPSPVVGPVGSASGTNQTFEVGGNESVAFGRSQLVHGQSGVGSVLVHCLSVFLGSVCE